MVVENMDYKYGTLEKYLKNWFLKHNFNFYFLVMSALMNRADVQSAS